MQFLYIIPNLNSMKKIVLIALALGLSSNFSAQTGNIGVATITANTTLDINGTTNINNEINLAGTDTNAGTSGTVGDLISGNGLLNPQWKKFDLPNGYLDGMILSASFLRSTTSGVSFVGAGNNGVPYLENSQLSNQATATDLDWKEIPGVRIPAFNITKSNNTVNIFVQTVAQITGSTGNGSFGCGIYIDDLLRYTRTGIVSGNTGSYRILSINATISGLAVGAHSFKFACAQRNVPSGNTLNVGQINAAAGTLSPTMAGTSASIKIVEQGN